MRVAITGASGNVGSRTTAHLLETDEVDQLVGIARRPPSSSDRRIQWVASDIGDKASQLQLTEAFQGVDAVVHLAWQIQPARDLDRMRRTNVEGSKHVFEAAAAAGVGAIVYVSSIGAYSPGPKDRAVDESWPTDGIPTSSYARHKATVERLLDETEQRHPGTRVVRFRPGLIFQAAAASEISRYFLGPFVPLSALRRGLIPVIPVFDRLVFQAVHTDDVAAAIARAVVDDTARGAFNLAADPVLDADTLARTLHARAVPTPFSVLRLTADMAYRTRVIPTDAGWLDMAASVPVMSTERARAELNWAPTRSSTEALLELLEGMHHATGAGSAVLRPAGSALSRVMTAARVAARGGPGAQNP